MFDWWRSIEFGRAFGVRRYGFGLVGVELGFDLARCLGSLEFKRARGAARIVG